MTKKDNLFLKSTLILMISGFLTKLIGFVIRIIYTRIIGEEGISLFALATPTYSLLLTISTLAIPISISKLIAEAKENNKRSIYIVIASAIIIITINFILIIIMLLSSKFLATNLLKESRCAYILIAMAFTLPFVSISSVFKGYFYGKQNMVPHATSNVIEQIVRLLIIITILPKLVKISVLVGVIGLVLLTILSEICSIIVFLCFLPKQVVLPKKLLAENMIQTKNILNIALPSVSNRIIGNIGYFFEPIILTNILLKTGYSNSYILLEYGAYNAYALMLLTMPSFFINAISMSLIPELSRLFNSNKFILFKRRLKQGLLLSFIIGIFFSTIIFIFREDLLMIIYKTKKGADYIKVLAPFFVLFYLEGVLISSLQAINKAKDVMIISFYGVLVKISTLILLSFFHIGIYSLVIAEIINILFVVINYFYALKKHI